jgi:hypothetical protein
VNFVALYVGPGKYRGLRDDAADEQNALTAYTRKNYIDYIAHQFASPIAPNLHVCMHMLHPAHNSALITGGLPFSAISIAGQPSLMQAWQDLHFA